MMFHCLFLLLSTMIGDSFQDGITSTTNAVHALEGSSVALSCNYTATLTGGSLQWYRQYPRSKPEFLILIIRTEEREEKDGRIVNHDKAGNHVDLELSSAKVTDSALYYCALQNTQGFDKLIFGEGTKLTIESNIKSSPSYYKLKSKDDTVSACLATGFSEYSATDKVDPFSSTETNPTRIDKESYFDKVVVLSKDIEESCPEKNGTDTDTCDSGAGGHFETDEKVNFLSLTVLWLRILFLKSIVFNVLMTLRAWMS